MSEYVPKHSAEEEELSTAAPFLNNAWYNRLKWIAQYGLPALGTLYFTIATIWGLPNAAQVVGTITAIDVALGILLGISSAQYNKSDTKYDGTVGILYDENGTRKDAVKLNMPDPSDYPEDKKELTLKVVPPKRFPSEEPLSQD